MTVRRVVVRADPRTLADGLGALRTELQLPAAFAPDVVADANDSVRRGPSGSRVDRTDVPFVTIDPPGSRDLDQAMALERTGDGFLVRYAIADVGAWVEPRSPLDRESWARGETLYFPDERVPLYPAVLGEGAASLLPDVDRPAVLWTLRLDATGELRDTEVERATVRSRRRCDYATVQSALDAGTADDWASVLRDVGVRRIALQRARGGADLRVPEQRVDEAPDGSATLTYRASWPVEDWNAQISMLTGIAAARLMLRARVGLLRTLPAPDARTIARFRRTADALAVAWPDGDSYADILAALDPADPPQAALLNQAAPLFRGSAYTAFDGGAPSIAEHAGVGAPYAHATAPLRRLADRYVSDLCVAIAAGHPVPAHVRDALPRLPAAMAASGGRAHAVDRAVVDFAEALLLSRRVGETFDAVVVDADDHSSVVQLAKPAVRSRMATVAPMGGHVLVRLERADPGARTVTFVPA
jgi:exoribonuclease R